MYESGIKANYKFCEKFKIQPLPASSLTLQFFCVHNSCYTSYKTLEVFLAAICLRYLEQGLNDPTNNQLLHLVCRGIRRLQGDKIRKRLPITINLLRTLKSQLANSTFFTVLEQQLLWVAFSLAFYSFMRVSEFTTPPTSDTFSPPRLHWSDIQLNTNSMSLNQKLIPFDKAIKSTSAQPIHLHVQYGPGISTCPAIIPPANRKGPLFNSGRFSPLSHANVTTTLRQLLHGTNEEPVNYSSHSLE